MNALSTQLFGSRDLGGGGGSCSSYNFVGETTTVLIHVLRTMHSEIEFLWLCKGPEYPVNDQNASEAGKIRMSLCDSTQAK